MLQIGVWGIILCDWQALTLILYLKRGTFETYLGSKKDSNLQLWKYRMGLTKNQVLSGLLESPKS